MATGVLQYEALIAAGRARLHEWRLGEALTAFDAALRLKPCDPAVHYLRGEALFLQRRLDEALASHAAARDHGLDRIDGGRGAAMSGIVPGDYGWMCHMLRGDLTQAWRAADAEAEQRRRAGIASTSWPRHMRPVWDGRPLDGARVLVRCYHGLGDTIQFIRYVPLLSECAAAVAVEAQPELLPILSPIAGIDRLYPLEQDDTPVAAFGCDREIDVTELPYAFRTTLETIPGRVPYLQPTAAARERAAHRLARISGNLRVGLVWAAGAWRPERSLPLRELAPLAAVPSITLIALQRGPAYDYWRAAGEPHMKDGYGSDDIAEAAAMIMDLDLVVTVDTMIAHLAGALAAPVWVMLHFAADWRWLIDRNDSPWYPTMRLFRQDRPGDWAPVVTDVAAALAQLPGRQG